MIRENAGIWKGPAKDIMDNNDSDILVDTRYIDIVLRYLILLTGRLTIPIEAGDAALRHRAQAIFDPTAQDMDRFTVNERLAGRILLRAVMNG